MAPVKVDDNLGGAVRSRPAAAITAPVSSASVTARARLAWRLRRDRPEAACPPYWHPVGGEAGPVATSSLHLLLPMRFISPPIALMRR